MRFTRLGAVIGTVAALAACNAADEQERVLAAGADAFMSKPFSPIELIAKVREMLDG